MRKETTLLDYAMFIARERELCVQGLPSDEAGAVERFIAAADRAQPHQFAEPAVVGPKDHQFSDGTRTLRQDCISAVRDFANTRPEDDETWESWFEAAFDLCESRVGRIFDEHAAAHQIAEPASEETELLPCPFCGCALEAHWRRANPKAMCRTEGCVGAKLPVLNLDQPDAIAAWNTRAADRAQRQGDDQDLAQLHENGAKAWADAPDATAWVDELRCSDAIDTSPERDEKQSADVHMPVVAWYGSIARCHEVVGLKQNHVLREFEAGEIVPEALVRQSDVQVALAGKDAEIDALKAERTRAVAEGEGKPRRVAEGAIYRHEIDGIYNQGRVCLVPYDPGLPVHTVWDLGWNDAMTIGMVPERLYAATVPAPVQRAAQYLSGSDMADLRQLDEEFSAGGGWCLPKARMKRLAELGVIRHGGGGHYSITSFGSLILGGGFFRLPLETVEECNARIGKEHNAIKAQQGGQHGAE